MAKGTARLHFELRHKSRHDFQNFFASLLGELLEGAAQSKKLGILDRSGIDAFVIKSDDEAPQLVVQCKGFEVFEYGPKQHAQCRAEVEKYASFGPVTLEYWLVINRPIKDRTMRDEILADLNGLVTRGKALKAELLDSASMHARLHELAKAQLVRWGNAKRLRFQATNARPFMPQGGHFGGY